MREREKKRKKEIEIEKEICLESSRGAVWRHKKVPARMHASVLVESVQKCLRCSVFSVKAQPYQGRDIYKKFNVRSNLHSATLDVY